MDWVFGTDKGFPGYVTFANDLDSLGILISVLILINKIFK